MGVVIKDDDGKEHVVDDILAFQNISRSSIFPRERSTRKMDNVFTVTDEFRKMVDELPSLQAASFLDKTYT